MPQDIKCQNVRNWVTHAVYNKSFIRKVDKSKIPVCNVLGVNIAAIDMKWAVEYIAKHVKDLSGDYVCVSNVHTTVMSYDNPEYSVIQNGGIMALPDGGPLSFVGRRHGYKMMKRIAGPDLMREVFKISEANGFQHFFLGSTDETLKKLCEKLRDNYPGLRITGVYSPPFRPLTEEEDAAIIGTISSLSPDFIWIGLGAPKQEEWMAKHQGRIKGLMIGVGAGFDYYAGNLKRAPGWMQNLSLEWLYRLMQEPRRLLGRYWYTNTRFIRLIARRK